MAESIAALIARAISFAGLVGEPSRDYASGEGRVAALVAAARSEDSPALTLPAAPARASLRALAAAVLATWGVAVPAYADTPERGDFDARASRDQTPSPRDDRARDALRDRMGRFGLVAEDGTTDAPRAVAKLNGFLTDGSEKPAAEVALDYVRSNPAVFGLDADDIVSLRLSERTVRAGVVHLKWEQRYRGVPSSDTQLAAAVTGSGRLLAVTGPAAADLAVPTIEPVISAERAYATVRRSGRAERPTVSVRSRAGGAVRRTDFVDGGTASLVLYQNGRGSQLAWRVLAPLSSSEVYDATVDATTGAVVRRVNRVDFAGQARVFRINPAAASQQDFTFPDAWLPPGSTTLSGPYVHAFADPSDHVGLGVDTPRSQDEIPSRPDGPDAGTWKYPLTTSSITASNGCSPSRRCTWDRNSPFSWNVNRNQSATQLFYLVNTFRAHLAGAVGFDEFSGDDPVLAQAMDGADGPRAGVFGVPDSAHVNNASFLSLPDGTPALLQSHLFMHDAPWFGDHDAANDASIIFHEYTHGLSSRLVADPQGFGALNTPQAGAIGEGTSDFFALDYLAEQPGFPPPGEPLRLGTYFDGGDARGVRYQAIDCDPSSVAASCDGTVGTGHDGGFTFHDFGHVFGEPEVHSDGEIWAQTLWDLREAMIERYDPSGTDPSGRAAGITRARLLITDALRMAPLEPSFLDMRNAILAANTDAVDEGLIWNVFADRGMGYFASTYGSRDVNPVADDTPPAATPATGTIAGVAKDEAGALLANVEVGVSGHDTHGRTGGLGPELADTTSTDGSYSITAPVGRYPLIVARHDGFRDGEVRNVDVADAATITKNVVLERDWASESHGATVERFSGFDNSSSGCGPDGLIDDDPGVVWGTENVLGGQTIVIDLGAPIDIAKVAIDPGAGCGDDPSAGLRDYELRASTAPDRDFRPLGNGSFGTLLGGFLRDVPSSSGLAVRYVALHAESPQSTGGSGAQFMDVAELHVVRQKDSLVGPSANTGSAQGVGFDQATLSGVITPHDDAAEVFFEYGSSTTYGATLGAGALEAGNTASAVNAVASGLQPSTTYHFRVVARSGGNTYPGADKTFTTAAAPSPTPTPTPSPTPRPTPGPVAKVTSLSGARLTADRKGLFKVKVRFGDAAPVGRARITVSRKGKRLARASTPVRQGKTVTKTLRLNSKGRKVIRRGRTRKVKVQLRLPGGEKLTKTVKLTRKRR